MGRPDIANVALIDVQSVGVPRGCGVWIRAVLADVRTAEDGLNGSGVVAGSILIVLFVAGSLASPYGV